MLNVIDYITIASLGDAINFGDLSYTNSYIAATASQTRGLFAGGYSPFTNNIEYLSIDTTGDTTDYGDLTLARGFMAGCSDSHGGLG